MRLDGPGTEIRLEGRPEELSCGRWCEVRVESGEWRDGGDRENGSCSEAQAFTNLGLGVGSRPFRWALERYLQSREQETDKSPIGREDWRTWKGGTAGVL